MLYLSFIAQLLPPSLMLCCNSQANQKRCCADTKPVEQCFWVSWHPWSSGGLTSGFSAKTLWTEHCAKLDGEVVSKAWFHLRGGTLIQNEMSPCHWHLCDLFHCIHWKLGVLHIWSCAKCMQNAAFLIVCVFFCLFGFYFCFIITNEYSSCTADVNLWIYIYFHSIWDKFPNSKIVS